LKRTKNETAVVCADLDKRTFYKIK